MVKEINAFKEMIVTKVLFSTTDLRSDTDRIGHIQFAHNIQKTELDIDYIEEPSIQGYDDKSSGAC